MNEQKIINELATIIACCEVTKAKALALSKKLARIHESASRKRAPRVSEEVIAEVLAKRQKIRMKQKPITK